MSGLGGHNPLPLRLGGQDAEASWTAEDHAAVCRDLSAAMRALPLAHVLLSRSGTQYTIESYRGVNGDGTGYAPEVQFTASNEAQLAWPLNWIDEFNEHRVFALTQAMAQPASASSDPSVTTASITNTSEFLDGSSSPGANGGPPRQVVQVLTSDGGRVLVTVWGTWRTLGGIEDYDGATDKINCESEVVPYSFVTLRQLQDARGSAYTKERGGLVHVENMALSRAHAATWRRAERLAANGNPATASEKADEWRQVLGVRRRDGDTDATLRTRNAAKVRLFLGPTRTAVDDAIAELLGTLYVRTWRNFDAETMADDAGTFWPTVNPGAASHDLGGGPWYSDRQHLVVEIARPASVTNEELDRRITDLVEFLDLVMPATVTFDWCTGADDGFTLDEDLLDDGCLGG